MLFTKIALPFDFSFCFKPICPRHPGLLLGSHQVADCGSAPREFHPRQVLCRLPPLPATAHGVVPLHARTVAGQEYHCPHCRSSPYREQPDTHNNCISLSEIQPNADKIKVGSGHFGVQNRGAVAKVAYAYHKGNGKVLDEWVFNFQRAIPFVTTKRKGEGFLSLHPIAAGNP